MSVFILLDSGPVGLLTHTRATAATLACGAWLESLLTRDVRVVLPEIADYEVRRELLRIGSTQGIIRLDMLKTRLYYLPISTDIMLRPLNSGRWPAGMDGRALRTLPWMPTSSWQRRHRCSATPATNR